MTTMAERQLIRDLLRKPAPAAPAPTGIPDITPHPSHSSEFYRTVGVVERLAQREQRIREKIAGIVSQKHTEDLNNHLKHSFVPTVSPESCKIVERRKAEDSVSGDVFDRLSAFQ